jgi:hypothetical protein
LPLNKRPFVLLLLKAKWIWTIISIPFPVQKQCAQGGG